MVALTVVHSLPIFCILNAHVSKNICDILYIVLCTLYFVTTLQRSQNNLRTMFACICRVSMLKLPSNPFLPKRMVFFSMSVHIGSIQNGIIMFYDICLIVCISRAPFKYQKKIYHTLLLKSLPRKVVLLQILHSAYKDTVLRFLCCCFLFH